MSKILIHTIAFSPDGVSTAYLYNDIALRFKDAGYEVVVLTTTPHYNVVEFELKKQPLRKKALGLYSESNYQGINVKHIPQKKYKSSLLRILGFIFWHIMSFFLGIFEPEIDIILSPSPPLTIGFLNIVLGKLKRAKVIYNVQEIYPDLLIDSGALRSKTIISILKSVERFIYNYSTKVTTIDKIFYDTIIDRFKDKSKLCIIPNFVDTSIYKPLTGKQITLDSVFFPENDSLKLMYAGNIGHAQDWEPLMKIAIRLKAENIEFFIIGEGVMKDFLENEIKSNDLTNVHLIPYQNRTFMPSLIAYSDIQFIFMSPTMDGRGFPSKVYTIMACAKPLIVCSGKNTPIMNFLNDKKCAFLIDERDIEKKTDQLVTIIKTITKKELELMGKSGLTEIEMNYSKEIVADKYINLANSLLK